MKIVAPLVALVALPGCQAEESAANRTVTSNAVADVVPTPANAAEPGKPAIPERFRGLWAEDQRACGELTHRSRLVVGDDDLRFPDFVLEVEEVNAPSGDSFAVKGRNKTSDAPAEAHYSIDVTGGILTDQAGGGTVRVRCG